MPRAPDRPRASLLVLLAVLFTAGVATADDETPVSYVVVLDRSVSMQGDKLELAASAIVEQVEKLAARDRVAVVSFGRTATVVSPLRAPDAKRLARKLAAIKPDTGDNLAAGIHKADDLLATISGLRHVVVVTDSEASKGVAAAIARVKGRGITVSGVGVGAKTRAALDLLGQPDNVDYLELLPSVCARAFEVPALKRTALVLVIDRSGSMQGAKLEAAKEAARMTADLLGATDMIGVVAFDTDASVKVKLQRMSNRTRISYDISRILSGGGSNVYVGLAAARDELDGLAGHDKHVIVLSDGESPSDGVADVVAEMRASGITVSAVGLQGADRDLLGAIADQGDGRLYMVDDLATLPKISLRETTP